MYLPVPTTSSGSISVSINEGMGMNLLRVEEEPVASTIILAVMLKVEPSDLRPLTPVIQPFSESSLSAVAPNMNSTPNFLASLTCLRGASFRLKRYPSPSKRTLVFLSGE